MNNGIQDVINWILNKIVFLWIKIGIEVTKEGNLNPNGTFSRRLETSQDLF